MEIGMNNSASYGGMKPVLTVQKIEEPTFDIDDPIHKIDSFDGVRAKGKNKELLDFLINEKPDSIVSDELELYILKILMLDEGKIKMPKVEEMGELGLTFPEENNKIKNTYYHEDENSIDAGIIYTQNMKTDIVTSKTSSTSLHDYDKDGYADALAMFAYDSETPKKDIYIDLNRYMGYSEIEKDKSSIHQFRASK